MPCPQPEEWHTSDALHLLIHHDAEGIARQAAFAPLGYSYYPYGEDPSATFRLRPDDPPETSAAILHRIDPIGQSRAKIERELGPPDGEAELVGYWIITLVFFDSQLLDAPATSVLSYHSAQDYESDDVLIDGWDWNE